VLPPVHTVGRVLGVEDEVLWWEFCVVVASELALATSPEASRDDREMQHSTAQHSATQHSTAPHSTAQRSAAQHSTARTQQEEGGRQVVPVLAQQVERVLAGGRPLGFVCKVTRQELGDLRGVVCVDWIVRGVGYTEGPKGFADYVVGLVKKRVVQLEKDGALC